MNRPADHPALRLVNSADSSARLVSFPRNTAHRRPAIHVAPGIAPSRRETASPTLVAARRSISQANVLASGMSPLDARWVFALRAAGSLEGGIAAILRPEVRRRLVTEAQGLGLRPFDANLIIAIVQDGRRSGAGGLNPEVESRLTLIQAPELVPAARPARWLGPLIGIAIMALTMTYVMCSWMARG